MPELIYTGITSLVFDLRKALTSGKGLYAHRLLHGKAAVAIENQQLEIGSLKRKIADMCAAPHPWQPEATAPMSGAAPKDYIELLVTYPIVRDAGTTAVVFTAHRDELGWDTGQWRLHETPWAWMHLPEPAKEKM